jgi:hypothetical protein
MKKMFRRNYKNGRMSLFNQYAILEDGKRMDIGNKVGIDPLSPLGRIEMFIKEYGYIKAIVKGEKYFIDELYFYE